MSKQVEPTGQHHISSYLQGIDVSNETLEQTNLLYFTTDSSLLIPPPIPKPSPTETKISSKETPITTNPYGHIPQVPALPPNLDPKKTCPFCHKIFSHHGSLGRHLDKQKGRPSHPFDIITEMRALVARKGDIESIRLRKKSRSLRYNSKQSVKERNKIQRRLRERRNRFKRMAIDQFIESLGRPVLPPHPSFPRLVVYFLSPDLWPHDPPSLETHRLLTKYITQNFSTNNDQEPDLARFQDIMVKLKAATDNWLTLTDHVKLQIWTRELRKAAEEALSGISLAELAERDGWISKKSEELMQGNGEEEEEEEEEGVSSSNEDSHDDGSETVQGSNQGFQFEEVDLATVAGLAVEP